MVKTGSYVERNFVAIANDLIEEGHINHASLLASFLVTRFGDSYDLEMLFKTLVRLERDEEAIQLLNKNENSGGIDASFSLAQALLDNGHREKSLQVISDVADTVSASQDGEDKANLALYFAKLGKEQSAQKFIFESMKGLAWSSGKPERAEGEIIDLVVETYRELGKRKEVAELLSRQGIKEEPREKLKEAEKYLSLGLQSKASELLDEIQMGLDPTEYEDSFELGRLIEIYLKIGRLADAERLARGLTGSHHMQQLSLLQVADVYIKTRKKREHAFKILNFALAQTRKIDTSEPESGMLSTSGKWDQALDQSRIATRFIKMRLDKRRFS